MRKHWNKEELDFLKKSYEIEGLSLTEIFPIFNKKFNRTSVGLQVKIGKLKLRHTKEQKIKVKSRLNSGEKNGMYGKPSPLRGKTKENSEIVRKKSKKK